LQAVGSSGAFEGGGEGVGADGFDEVVGGFDAEGFEGVLVVGGAEDQCGGVARRLRWEAAAMPSMPGMRTSMRTMSGWVRSASLRAPSPLLASPQTQ